MSLSHLWRVARTDPRRIMRADREVVAATLRREAGLAFAPVTRFGRRAVTTTLSRLPDRGRTAEAVYARVLDGQTLNLLVSLPDGLRAETAAVLFGGRDAPEPVPATPRDGGRSAEATVLLGARGIALGPGRRRILLTVTSADGREETYTLRHADPGRDGGPTRADPPCPDTGNRYQIGFSPAGILTMTVVPPDPAAELTGLRVDATGVRLTGRFLGIEDPAGSRIVFAGPDRREHRVPAILGGNVFEAAVPVAALADRTAERAWKVWADVPEAGRLRVGRFNTDLSSPNAVHRRPNRMIRLDGRAFAMVRATYAAAGGLTLVCAAGEAVK